MSDSKFLGIHMTGQPFAPLEDFEISMIASNRWKWHTVIITPEDKIAYNANILYVNPLKENSN